MGVKSNEILYDSYIDPIMNYVSGVWGFVYFNTRTFYKIELYAFISESYVCSYSGN